MFYPFIKDTQERWAWKGLVFTPEECDYIIESTKPHLSAAMIFDSDPNNFGKNKLDDNYRKSSTAFIQPLPENDWIFQRVSAAAMELNAYWNFDLAGFGEGLQFTEYQAPGGKYDLHIDKTYNGVVRKLSIIIQLSDPADFDGGDLKYKDSTNEETLPKAKGMMIAFPSYALHGVTPVTRGTRYTLVGWITGPNLK
jgi:PKHD-type hydroxylase